jgi:23S rRNA (uracil747-C5)-methyltransferase
MGVPYEQQLADKQRAVAALVETTWLPAVASAESGFRSKAKLAVGGTASSPTLGILDREYRGVDLTECGIHTRGIRAAIPRLARFVTDAGLEPYDVAARRGELKHLLVTESPDGEFMLRVVLRSPDLVPAVRAALPALASDLPLRVVSVNLLPAHVALLEGEEETVLTPESTLPIRLGDLTLHLGVRSFFQTNLPIARALYAQAAEWVAAVAPRTVWDLYCGVGGFALAVAPAVGQTAGSVTGVESSDEAIVSARRSAVEAGLVSARFVAADATSFALAAPDAPELVIVNPPRRGLDADLCAWLEASGVRHVVYSSCAPDTLARDLARMPSFAVREGRVFDMFPQTRHAEVMVRLERA